MHERRVRLQPNLVARIELVTFAEYGDDLLAAEFGEHLRFRAGRLDHDDLGFGAVVSDGEVLGANAVDRGTAIRRSRRALDRQLDAVRAFEGRNAVDADVTLEEVHGRRTDEARDELVVGL